MNKKYWLKLNCYGSADFTNSRRFRCFRCVHDIKKLSFSKTFQLSINRRFILTLKRKNLNGFRFLWSNSTRAIPVEQCACMRHISIAEISLFRVITELFIYGEICYMPVILEEPQVASSPFKNTELIYFVAAYVARPQNQKASYFLSQHFNPTAETLWSRQKRYRRTEPIKPILTWLLVGHRSCQIWSRRLIGCLHSSFNMVSYRIHEDVLFELEVSLETDILQRSS